VQKRVCKNCPILSELLDTLEPSIVETG